MRLATRKLRIQYSGAVYHVMNRGGRQEGIFRDDADLRCFLETLSETCDKTEGDYKPIRRRWRYGEAQFREELLAQVEGKLGNNHYGQERQESAEQKALRILEEDVRQRSVNLEQLRWRRSGDAVKLAIARRLRQDTTMSLRWVAQQLGVGIWKYLSYLLSTASAQGAPSASPETAARQIQMGL